MDGIYSSEQRKIASIHKVLLLSIHSKVKCCPYFMFMAAEGYVNHISLKWILCLVGF